MHSSSLTDPVCDRMPVPYTAVPVDVLERQARDCEAKASDPALPVHEAQNLLRQANQFRAAISLEEEHRAGCKPYSFKDVIEEQESWALDATCTALLIGAALTLSALVIFGGAF